jgi:hypothetical protein
MKLNHTTYRTAALPRAGAAVARAGVMGSLKSSLPIIAAPAIPS